MSFQVLKSQAKETFSRYKSTAILIILIQIVIFGFLSPTVLGLFLIQPLNIGISYAFIRMARQENADFNDLIISLKNDYLNHVVQLALKFIYLILWSFLLVVPAIIKYFSYFMVEYILADDPNEKDPITKSREMMNGHKFELFLLQLSFIGWFILSSFTFGLLYVLYVGPYYQATLANYYLAIKDKN